MTERPKIGLVLAGGGARGAYELGALSRLLPFLARRLKHEPGWPDDIDEKKWRPDIIVGTSVGALNTAYLAATAHEPLEKALGQGCDIWREISWHSALSRLASPAEARAIGGAALDLFNIPGAHARKLLDPSPLEKTLRDGPLSKSREGGIPFAEIHENVHTRKRIEAAAVVATRASTSLSQVFYDGRGVRPSNNNRRGIEYAPTRIGVDHVRASAAIPSAFPPVRVTDPPEVEAWYYDGGTRLNTPIKPAIDLGATHLIVVALHCTTLGKFSRDDKEPELLDGAKQLIQGVLVDPLVNDLHTLANINEILDVMPAGQAHVPASESGRARSKTYRQIPYIVIAPETPRAIGERAVAAFNDRYAGPKNLARRYHSVAMLGRQLDIDHDSARGELFSYLFFDPDFGSSLVELGQADADRWIGRVKQGQAPLWETGPHSAATAPEAVR
jgi:NTE family protein